MMKERSRPLGAASLDNWVAHVLKFSLCWNAYLGSGQFALTILAALAVPIPEVKSHPTPAL
jgi:hypothetical protein